MDNEASAGIGRYRRLAELGRGGMATVYLAAARGPQGFTKLVVLKELRPDLAQDPEFRTMFLDEARLAARLNHPNVVQTYEVGELSGQHVIVMEFLDGQPLSRARKVLPPPLCYFALSNVLTGLEHAHDLHDFDGKPLRVVHRDVSPHNIFVTYSGEVKLCDFGIAKAADSSAITATGDLKGKLSYMAPEQARGEQVDARADLFSVGVMLWETATGRRLWNKLQDVQILAQLFAGSIPSPRSLDPSVPERLDAICMRALAYDREQRYGSAADMQADLDAFIVSLGLTPTRRALGEAVARAFAEDRSRLKTLIDQQLRTAALFSTGEAPAVSYVPSSMPSSVGSAAGAELRSASETSMPAAETVAERSGITGSGGGRTATGAVHTIRPHVTSGRAWLLGAIASLVAVIAVVGFIVRGQLARKATSAGTTASAATSGDAEAAASSDRLDAAVAPMGPPLKHIAIRATPPGAAFFLDGEPITPLPDGTIERPAGETHRLRVEAAGFAPEERSLSFDADRTVDVRLARARDGAAPGGKPGASSRPKPTDPSEVLGY